MATIAPTRFTTLLANTGTAIALLFAAGLWAPPALAIESDKHQPIRIQADAGSADDAAGTYIYRGNVTITQGTLNVTADEVEILTRDDTIIRIVASADSPKLARYKQQTNHESEMVYADAREITYLVQEEQLHLSGNARVQQVENVFSGELLHYDMARGIVDLLAGPDPDDRVNMTITPKKDQ